MIALNVLQTGLSLLENHSLFLVFSFLLSFVITFYLIPLAMRMAQQYGILDLPDGAIKTHKTPTPYLGGVAVCAGFVVAVLLCGAVDARISFLLLGCTMLMLLGFADDLLVLSPVLKFGGQALIALSFVRAGLYLKESFFTESWAIPLSLLWLLTCMNAINLIDVMDGLATTVALCASGGYLIFSVLNGNMMVAQVLILFMGALGAFFYYNRPQAKIYLGDAGSLFVGGFLGVIPLLISWSDFVPWGFLLAPLPMSVALLELLGLMVIRTYKGIPFYKGSKDHLCHYLGRKGYSRWAILGYVTFFSLSVTIVGLAAYVGFIPLPTLFAVGIIFFAVWVVMLKPK